MAKNVIDTNVLMNNVDVLNTLEGDILIPVFVLEELDKLKTFPDHRGAQARAAVRFLRNNPLTNLTFDVDDDIDLDCLPETWDKTKYDNKILAFAYNNRARVVSQDFNVQLKAKHLGLPYHTFDDMKPQRHFTGVREIFVECPQTDVMFLAHSLNPNDNIYELHINEYLVIYDANSAYINEREEVVYKKVSGTRIMRWNGEEFVGLKLPKSLDIKPLNDLQECALDLLYCDDIPIKIITGGYGSGKTILSLRTGLYGVQTDKRFDNVLCIRNPIGDTDSQEIGFLKGDKEDKLEDYFKPIQHNLPGDNSDYLMRLLVEKQKLQFESPAFMKGTTIRNSFMLVDEAEDLTLKTLKLIGTRMGEGSVICFSGDYKQVEARYKNDNGLVQFIDATKDAELVGCVQLVEDVRSSASKVFANIGL